MPFQNDILKFMSLPACALFLRIMLSRICISWLDHDTGVAISLPFPFGDVQGNMHGDF